MSIGYSQETVPGSDEDVRVLVSSDRVVSTEKESKCLYWVVVVVVFAIVLCAYERNGWLCEEMEGRGGEGREEKRGEG